MRIRFCLIIAMAVTLTSGAHGQSPNVVLIMADDLGYHDLSGYGHPEIKTPVLDQLAEDGVKLTSFYAGATVCTPSRMALLTGAYPSRLGWTKGVIGYLMEPGSGLQPEALTMAEVFRDEGYATGIVGKWHLGDESPMLPMEQGFEDAYYIKRSNNQTTQLWRGKTLAEDPFDNRQLTKQFTDEAVRFIRDHKASPFFLYVPFNAVHGPLNKPPRYPEMDVRSAMLKCMDDAVGRIVSAIDKQGLKENTLVIFTNDNGPVLEEMSKPYRGAKNTTYEGGVRVPCVLRWPGKAKPGSAAEGMMFVSDWFATFVKLAGGSLKQDRPLDALDMSEMIFNGEPSPRNEIIFEVSGSVRTPTIRSGDFKLMGDLLYNVAKDPGEKTDVAAKHPDVVAKLKGRLDEVGKERPPLGDKPLLMDPPLPYIYGIDENKDPAPWLVEHVKAIRAKQPQEWAPGKTPWPQAPKAPVK